MNKDLVKAILESIKGVCQNEIALNIAMGTGIGCETSITLFTDEVDKMIEPLFDEFGILDNKRVRKQYHQFINMYILDQLDLDDLIEILEGNFTLTCILKIQKNDDTESTCASRIIPKAPMMPQEGAYHLHQKDACNHSCNSCNTCKAL